MSVPASKSRPSLLDGMVLISLVAVGLALAKDPLLRSDWEMISVAGGASAPWKWMALYRCSLIFPCITPLTFALPVMGYLRSPRSRGRKFLRPGLGGCLAADFALLMRSLEDLPHVLHHNQWMHGPIQPWFDSGEKVGYAVIGAWAILAAGRRWRIEPGWLEHLALMIGLIWAIATVGFVAIRIQ